MTKSFVVAEMAVRDLARRRGAVLLLFVVPLVFYMARHDHMGQAVRFAGLGLGWAVATAAVFSGTAAKALEPRLRLSGYRTRQLVGGRLAALTAVATVLGGSYLALILVDQDVQRVGALVLAFGLTAAVAVPLGLVLGAVLPRELEAMLVLLTVFGLQMLLDPADTISRLLPFWSLRELATYAVDLVDGGYLRRGALHGVATSIGLTVVLAIMATVRLRRRPHLRLRTARGEA